MARRAPKPSVQFLGIYREKRFSPGVHAAGDAEILELTQAALQQAGHPVTLITPEALPSTPMTAQVVFSMCQSLEALAILQAWEAQGVLVLNTPAAVRTCYRLELVPRLSQSALPFPRSHVVTLTGTGLPAQALIASLPADRAGWWVKRGDVHAMQADDVLLAPTAADVIVQLERLRQRGISHAIVQEHIPGQEIKFYAVHGQGVLHALAPHAPVLPPHDAEQLNTLACQAGEVCGLDIYGGDCLVTADDQLCLIDINDWPSFRGCRPVAATQIAQLLLNRARQRHLL
ncbi:MAG: RimK family alpha-L-glutamate ligase [Candidatus Tectimicrobiota bacterium]